MGQFLDFISNIVPITGNSTADTILFFIISAVAFGVAWFITGAIARGLDYDSDAMSLVHWIVRFLIFFGLLGLFIGVVHFIKWFLSFEWWIYLIIGVSVILIISGIAVLKIVSKNKKKGKVVYEKEQEN